MQVAKRKCKVEEGKKKWNEGNPRERVRQRVVSANRARGQMANGAKASVAKKGEKHVERDRDSDSSRRTANSCEGWPTLHWLSLMAKLSAPVRPNGAASVQGRHRSNNNN